MDLVGKQKRVLDLILIFLGCIFEYRMNKLKTFKVLKVDVSNRLLGIEGVHVRQESQWDNLRNKLQIDVVPFI